LQQGKKNGEKEPYFDDFAPLLTHHFFNQIFGLLFCVTCGIEVLGMFLLHHCSCDSFVIIPTVQQCKKKGKKEYTLMMLQFFTHHFFN
jgi:hypothetical protein